jgi:hypothetical protein
MVSILPSDCWDRQIRRRPKNSLNRVVNHHRGYRRGALYDILLRVPREILPAATLKPVVSALNPGIPPVLLLFYQEAWGGPTGASLLSRLR